MQFLDVKLLLYTFFGVENIDAMQGKIFVSEEWFWNNRLLSSAYGTEYCKTYFFLLLEEILVYR
jgi:hypothetical protein